MRKTRAHIAEASRKQVRVVLVAVAIAGVWVAALAITAGPG